MKCLGLISTSMLLLGTLTSIQASSMKKRDTGAASYTNNLVDTGASSYSSGGNYYSSGHGDHGHDSYDYYGGQESHNKGGFDILSLFGPIFGIKGKILEAVGQLIISKGHALAEIGQKLKNLDTKGNQGGYPAATGGYPGPSSGGKGKGKGGSYGAPKAPSSQYGTPDSGKGKGTKKPTSSYGSPNKPSGSYGTPKKPSGGYGTPNKPSGSYGTPHSSSSSYGQPPATYGDSLSSISQSYGAPQQSLSAGYGVPQSTLPVSYGTGASFAGSTYSDTAGSDHIAGLQAPQPHYGTSNTLVTSYNTVPQVQSNSVDNTQTYVSSNGNFATGATYILPQSSTGVQLDTVNYANTQSLSSYSGGTVANSAYETSNLNSVSYASEVQQTQPVNPVPPVSYGATSAGVLATQNPSLGNGYSGASYSEAAQPLPLSSYGSETTNFVDANAGYSDQASAYSELLLQYAKQQKQPVPPVKVVTNNATQLVKTPGYSPLIGYGLQEWHPLESKSNLKSTLKPESSVVIPTATNTAPSVVSLTPKAEVLSNAPKDNSTVIPKKKDLTNGGKFPL